MVIERSGFLLLAGTLAAGGVGGWLAHDSKSQRERAVVAPVAEPPLPVAAPSAPVAVVEHAPSTPGCDDSAGMPEDCPAVGPADEGVCSNVAAKRCADFKAAFKPRVAQAAVACLRHLKPNEMCDPSRVNLCGHSALMAACPDAASGQSGAPLEAPGNATPVSIACDAILKGCVGVPLGPTSNDCRQTLSGMTDAGRASMVACLATHCADKGLLGCEGLKTAPPARPQ